MTAPAPRSFADTWRVVVASTPVLEAAVVGADDPIRDEVRVAFVVRADLAAPPEMSDLDRWCAERLAKAKLPQEIVFLDELPCTSVGKIRKFVLAADAAKSRGGLRQ